jgi:acetyltransferase-like isoleucine patch superfamily enzyme
LENECESRPVRIGRNVWIGFEACVLPGVVIGEGSIVGARSVITENVPPFTVVAGNPARIVGVLDHLGRAPSRNLVTGHH